MDMADIYCYLDSGSYWLFHSSAKEMIYIGYFIFVDLDMEE